jgi:hypothetical protein
MPLIFSIPIYANRPYFGSHLLELRPPLVWRRRRSLVVCSSWKGSLFCDGSPLFNAGMISLALNRAVTAPSTDPNRSTAEGARGVAPSSSLQCSGRGTAHCHPVVVCVTRARAEHKKGRALGVTGCCCLSTAIIAADETVRQVPVDDTETWR